MPELTDAQKVMRNDTGKSIAEAIANMSITVAGQEVEVSDTEPQSKFVDVWFQEQQQGQPVEVYTVPEINDMIAPAETNPTQAAHHVGEYIICVLNGQAKLCKAIDEISIQETLTVGGNIEIVQNGGLNDIVSAQNIIRVNDPFEIIDSTIVSSFIAKDCYLLITGHLVYFSIRFTMAADITGSTIAMRFKAEYTKYLPTNYNTSNGVIAGAYETWSNATTGLIEINSAWGVGLGGGFKSGKNYIASGMYIID